MEHTPYRNAFWSFLALLQILAFAVPLTNNLEGIFHAIGAIGVVIIWGLTGILFLSGSAIILSVPPHYERRVSYFPLTLIDPS